MRYQENGKMLRKRWSNEGKMEDETAKMGHFQNNIGQKYEPCTHLPESCCHVDGKQVHPSLPFQVYHILLQHLRELIERNKTAQQTNTEQFEVSFCLSTGLSTTVRFPYPSLFVVDRRTITALLFPSTGPQDSGYCQNSW